MGSSIEAYIQIDDNTPKDEPPFTNDPSTWDLSHDLGLGGCKDYNFFAAICGIRNESNLKPLFTWRGLPEMKNEHDPVMRLKGDYCVSWLTLSEIIDSLAHMSVPYDSLSEHVLRVLECMKTLEQIVGKDRVRLVFQCE